MKKLVSLVLVLMLALSTLTFASAGEITDLRTYITSNYEMSHFNIFYSQAKQELDPLSNCLDGLLTNDNHGNLIPNAAKEWTSEDGGKTWTFVLQDGMTWFDYQGNTKADVVAEDWLWGMEWILNFAKNEAVNTSMPMEMIEGAAEYYQYTKQLAETDPDAALALGLEKFKEMVGVEAPDEKTLVYHCVDQLSYFPTLGTYSCLYPLSGALLAEVGVDGYKAITWDTMWYNGPYTITSCILGTEKTFTASPNYWNAANVKRFNTVNVVVIESEDRAYSLFQTGEIDNVKLTQSNLMTIYNNPGNEFHGNLVESRPDKYTMFMYFNFAKNNPDGTPDENWNKAINNEAFRKAWVYGLDWTPYLERYNAINPLSCQTFNYTGKGVAMMSDGRDYADVVLENMGLSYSTESYNRYQPELAAQYKAQAIEELTAQGVTFPIVVDDYIRGDNQTAADTAATLKQMISDCLGDDFVVLNIGTYVSSSVNEVLKPGLASIGFPAWGADFGDPVNYLGQYAYGDDNAFFSADYARFPYMMDGQAKDDIIAITETMKEAAAITDDLDARYAKFAEAEAALLSKGFLIPTYNDVSWELTCINDYSQVFCAYGNQSSRYIGWETNDEIYTTEEYAKLAAEYAAN